MPSSSASGSSGSSARIDRLVIAASAGDECAGHRRLGDSGEFGAHELGGLQRACDMRVSASHSPRAGEWRAGRRMRAREQPGLVSVLGQ